MQKDFITATPDSGTGGGTVTVSASANTGLERNSSINISGGGITRTINISQKPIYIEPDTAPNGVYIMMNNRKLISKNNLTESLKNHASGVAVKTSNCSFVIAKEEQFEMKWGGRGTLIDGCTYTHDSNTAKIDYKGRQNTEAIVAKLGTNSMYAARYCKEYTFPHGVQGYLPALGELYEAYQNKSEVDACMSLINGTPLAGGLYYNSILSSTQSSPYTVWSLYWESGSLHNPDKDRETSQERVRPFAPF